MENQQEETKEPEKQEEKQAPPNTKQIPIIITLIAAFIWCVASILQHCELSKFVNGLLIIVIIFMILGTIVKMVLDYSFKTMEVVPIDADESSASEDDVEGQVSQSSTNEDNTGSDE